MSLIKFVSGDGVEHEVEETSVAADLMRQNGFQQIGGPEPKASGRMLGAGVLPDSKAQPAAVDLSKLNRDGLIAEAAKVGIPIDAADKAQTKKVIVAAIEAKLAQADDADEDEETGGE